MFDFLTDFFSLFSKDTPEKVLKRQIKTLQKQLRSQKPPVVDKRGDSISAAFVQHLFEAVHPLQPALALARKEFGEKKGVSLRRLLLDSITTEEHTRTLAFLEEPELSKNIESLSKKDFYETMEEALRIFIGLYREDDKQRINSLYNRMQILGKIAEYDYSLFFRDFDPGFDLTNPGYVPKFSDKEGKYFLPDLKTMCQNFKSLTFDESLIEDIESFCTLLGRPGPDPKTMKTAFKKIEGVKERHCFETLVQALSGDLGWSPGMFDFNDSVVAGLLDEIITTKKAAVEAAYARIRTSNIDQLKMRLFKGEPYQPLKNYIPRNTETYVETGLPGFSFCGELDLTKAFLVLKYNKTLKEFLHLIILKGRYKDPAAQKKLNDAFHQLNTLLEKVTAFDESLSESGKIGHRLKVAALSMHKDRKAAAALGEVIEEANGEAKQVVSAAILIVKDLLELFRRIQSSYAEQSKSVMLNILDFEGTRTEGAIEKMRNYCDDYVLFLNTIKSMSA